MEKLTKDESRLLEDSLLISEKRIKRLGYYGTLFSILGLLSMWHPFLVAIINGLSVNESLAKVDNIAFGLLLIVFGGSVHLYKTSYSLIRKLSKEKGKK